MIKIENDNKGKLAELNLKNALNDLREATAFVKQKPLVITIIMTAVFANLMFTPLNVLEPIFVTKYLGMGVMGMSIFSSIISISVILGGVAIGKFGQKIDRNKTIFLCVLIGGISYTCLGLPSLFGTVLPVVIFVLSCTFVLGVCVSILNTVISSYLMEITPENMLGRVFSLLSMLFLCANPIGGVVTCISEVIGLGNLIIIAGSLLFIFSIILKIILETQERLHPAMDMEA
jgi:DHA3 family macrolide efflux protein-like MFS transporter